MPDYNNHGPISWLCMPLSSIILEFFLDLPPSYLKMSISCISISVVIKLICELSMIPLFPIRYFPWSSSFWLSYSPDLWIPSILSCDKLSISLIIFLWMSNSSCCSSKNYNNWMEYLLFEVLVFRFDMEHGFF